MTLVAVNYHYIRPSFDSPYSGIHGATPKQFREQLELFSRVGDFVSAVDIRDHIHGKARLPDRCFILTFDDGLREQYQWAWQILCRKGIPAIFFINTDPIEKSRVSTVHKIHLLRSQMATEHFLERLTRCASERGTTITDQMTQGNGAGHYVYDTPEVARLKYVVNFGLPLPQRDAIISAIFDELYPDRESSISNELYLSREHVKEIGASGCIGTHGHQHLPLGLLQADEIRKMLRLSIDSILSWSGRSPVAMSYPYGTLASCSETVAQIAAEEGIEYSFTMERAANWDFERPMHLARYDFNDLPGGKNQLFSLEELFDKVPTATWFRAARARATKKCAS